MSSPTIQQSVSSPNLSNVNTHISPPTHRNFLSKLASSSKTVRGRPKHGSRRKSTAGPSLASVKLEAYDINDDSSNSPYYKGLLDQSLAILDNDPCSAPHTLGHPISNFLSSGGYSPYYKGLTDYSLVTGDGDSWSPVLQGSNSLSYESSRYYRGLIDYSLALHGPQLASDGSSLGPHSHPISNSQSPPKIKTGFTLMELMTKGVDDDVGLVTEEKPLRERVSEASKVGNVSELAESTILERMESMTKGVDDDVELEIEKKPLTERVSEANKVGNVSEETVEKTSLEQMELVTKGVDDDAKLMIEEKPLSERVSEASKVGSVLEETILEETDLEKEEELKDIGLVGEKEKPLRERVSVSEQRVASEVPCKDGGDLTQEKLKDRSAEEGNTYEYTWATKYQPMTLGDFICNRDKAIELQTLVRKGCGCNHFIFEGPPSVGKRSMIRGMLREVFGPERVQVIEENKDFNLKGEMVDSIQVRIKKSLHHVEVNLSETRGYEEHVIVDLFKETYGKIINNSLPCSPENCQAIILYEADKLSTESLLYIKWLLEKYKGCNKVFFCCSDESKLQPVKSLCTAIHLSPPSSEEIAEILEFIGKQEEIKLSRDFVKKIILKSKNNLRQAIRSLEATCRNRDALKDDHLILTGWEDDILNIAKNIIEEQSPRQLYIIRRKLQSLMIHDVAPDFIYKSLVAELSNLVDDSLRSGLAKLDKEYNKASEIKFETMKQFGNAQNKQGESDERNNEPTKKNALTYLKVEEFIAKFMSWYRNSSEKK